MFSNNKDKKKDSSKPKASSNSASSAGSNGLNSLVAGTTLEGTLNADSDIRIDGTLKGNLNCKAKLIIGPSGRVEGQVRCQNAVIEGEMEGTLEVSELLNIRETAKVNGDVSTSKLIVQSGAVFNVSCAMGGAGISSMKPGAQKQKAAV